MTLRGVCYGRPVLHAWLLPDLNTLPNSCVRENSLELSGYGIGFWCTRSLVRILPGPYISAMYSFLCFFVMDFVRKMVGGGGGARPPGFAKEPLIPFNVKKMDFLPNRLSVINK